MRAHPPYPGHTNLTGVTLYSVLTTSATWTPEELKTATTITSHVGFILDIVRKSDMHSYNTRNKDTLKLPKIKYNWGKQRSRYHCFKDFNELERTVRGSAS